MNIVRTEGEILFERYLWERGLSFDFEKPEEGKRKIPDYSIDWHGEKCFLDVKDFERRCIPEESSAFDPYPPIREKILQGRKKFKEYREHCCALVLRNLGNSTVRLEFPDIVLGSMYGDAGFTFPVDVGAGRGDLSQTRQVFLGRGKMIRPYWSKPENTTLSALITLTIIQPHYVALSELFREHPGCGIEECRQELIRVIPNFDETLEVPRVIVWYNAYARIPFPSDLFNGPYDTHFGVVDGEQRITFRGQQLPQSILV